MADVFLIADMHFNHTNIINYENRPFVTAEEMNEALIKNWNSVVNKYAKVFVLGDFAFAPKKTLDLIVPRLRGYKILIMGNHDSISPTNYLNAGFNEVYKYPILYDKFYIFSHEPMDTNGSMVYSNIFGHVHSSSEYADYTKRSACVSVERKHMNYKPIHFDELKKLMKSCE